MIRKLSWAQRVPLGLGLLSASVLVVLESLSAETVATGVGLLVCGQLALVVLAMPEVRAAAVAGMAAASIAFTVLCQILPKGLDNTFGLVEMIALTGLTARSVIELRPKQSVLVLPLLFAAIVSVPVRGYTLEPLQLQFAVVIVAFGVLLVILLGMYLRLHDQRRIDANKFAKQEQRLAYARDLHDFVAHHVTAIVAQAQAVRYTATAGQVPGPEALDDLLAKIEHAGSQALASMRDMITVLREEKPAPLRTTLGEAIAEPVGHFAGPPVTTDVDDDLATTHLVPHVLDAVRHVVQESLTNVLRHASGATAVVVTARALTGDRLEIVVADNGKSTSDTSGGGYGLVGLTERVEVAGGTLTAGAADTGWRVTATMPLTRALP